MAEANNDKLPQGTSSESALEVLRPHSMFHRTAVYRCGDTVLRETGPWTPAVHALLHHLEQVGFSGSPRLVGCGYDAEGRETLTYIEGTFAHPGQQSEDATAAVGDLLRRLHAATASFHPPVDAKWKPWFGRELGGPARVIGHGDATPWNLVLQDGVPVALIDWDLSGPVDPLVELAQSCWLNANLYSDDIAMRHALPSLTERLQQLRAMVEGYRLAHDRHAALVDQIIEFAVSDAAFQADDAGVDGATEVREPGRALWALAWRTRTAAWLMRHRSNMVRALS